MSRGWNTDPQNLVKKPSLQVDSPTKSTAVSQRYNLDVTEDSEWILVHSSPKAQASLLYVQEAGEFMAQRDYFTRRRSVKSYLLKVVLDGEGVLDYEGRRYVCRPGSFFWIDCTKPHCYATSAEAERWHVVWMHFLGGPAQSYYEAFVEASQGSPMGALQQPAKIARQIREIIARYVETRNDYCTDVRVSAMVTNVLAECLAETLQNAPRSAGRAPSERIRQVQTYIEAHYTQRMTLDELASRFFINKYHLQKQFSQFMGKSPCEYQNELRIDAAKELLRMTDLSVNSIALRLGFESASYFIQLFKKRESVTPLQYRNRWM